MVIYDDGSTKKERLKSALAGGYFTKDLVLVVLRSDDRDLQAFAGDQALDLAERLSGTIGNPADPAISFVVQCYAAQPEGISREQAARLNKVVLRRSRFIEQYPEYFR